MRQILIAVVLSTLSVGASASGIFIECDNQGRFDIFQIDVQSLMVSKVPPLQEVDTHQYVEMSAELREAAVYSEKQRLLDHSAFEPGETHINFSRMAIGESVLLDDFENSPLAMQRSKHDVPGPMDRGLTFAVGAEYRLRVSDLRDAIEKKDFSTHFEEQSYGNKIEEVDERRTCRVVPTI